MDARLQGIGVSPGFAVGPARLLHSATARNIPTHVADDDQQIVDAAVDRTVQQLEAIAQKLRQQNSSAEAGIMDAQALMAQDPGLLEAITERIRGGDAAVDAVEHAIAQYRAMFEGLDDPYMRARAADVVDVGDRLLRNLQAPVEQEEVRQPAILVARDLSPSETASLDRAMTLGFVTDAGSPTSHTAILARSLGIPAVVGLRSVTEHVQDGDVLAIDGESGLVVLNPPADVRRQFSERGGALQVRRERLGAYKQGPTATRDGRRITLAANIGSPDDLAAALEAGAEGVGLMRTEFLFAERENLPSEDEQVAAYRAVLEAMPEHTVVVRTLDIGGDKPLAYLPQQQEMNPFLGVRGLRFTDAYPDVFESQLRALLRASVHGQLAIMFPLVTDIAQLRAARSTLKRVQQEAGGTAAAGIMIEVPAAALTAEGLAQHAEFFSVGTNDLVQYTLAVDRTNERVAHLYQPLHPAVLRLMRETVQGARAHGRWAGVCGEMAGDLDAIPLLVGLGFDELSMTANRIPEARERISQIDHQKCSDLAQRALLCRAAQEVIDLVHNTDL